MEFLHRNATRLEIGALLAALAILWSLLGTLGYTGPGPQVQIEKLHAEELHWLEVEDSIHQAQDDRYLDLNFKVDASWRLLCAMSPRQLRVTSGVACPQ